MLAPPSSSMRQRTADRLPPKRVSFWLRILPRTRTRRPSKANASAIGMTPGHWTMAKGRTSSKSCRVKSPALAKRSALALPIPGRAERGRPRRHLVVVGFGIGFGIGHANLACTGRWSERTKGPTPRDNTPGPRTRM